MPRKTKETQEIEKEVKKTVAKKATTKKSTAKKEVTKKIEPKKSATTKKTVVKKAEPKKTATTKKTAAKKAEPKKTTTTKKTVAKKAEAKKTTTKKTATKKAVSKKTTTKKATTKKTSKKIDIVEYYDLPYRYNQTIVKVLAQTPNNLFIYWDISDEDREKYKKQFGENFFETTKPVLRIFNDTMNYSFEIDINDFANCWYLHVNDSKCDYRVELARRPIYSANDIGGNEFISIYISNEIESPNDRVLIDQLQKMVYFRNTKTNQIIGKSFASISFLRNMGKIYNVYDLYKELYKDEDLYNPSSKFF